MFRSPPSPGNASLRYDSRGAAMLEFGLVLPLLAFLMMIIVDSSRGFAAKLKLETAAARTLEKVTAMGVADPSNEPIKREAAAASGQPVSNVQVDKWVECAGARKPSFNDACEEGQEIARYLSISIVADYVPMFNAASIASVYGGRGLGDRVRIEGDSQVRLQ